MQGTTGSSSGRKMVVLKRIRPEKNERRFYALAVAIDLFGDTLLVRNWGRVGTGGRQRMDLYMDAMAAVAALEGVAERKLRRGYS